MNIMCRQCEQAAQGKGCGAPMGICGKDEKTAALQDLLIYTLQLLAPYSDSGNNEKISQIIRKGLFTTVTNVDFDAEHIADLIKGAHAAK